MGFTEMSTITEKKVNWTKLENIDQLKEAIDHSFNSPVIFFKHSTRCGVSTTALKNFERSWQAAVKNCKLYFIDVLANRQVSDLIAQLTNVVHESPQVIVIKENNVIYSASHNRIDAEMIQKKI